MSKIMELEEMLLLKQEYLEALEAKNVELENRINVLEFHLQEIADSDLVASNLKAMARNAIKKQALAAIKGA